MPSGLAYSEALPFVYKTQRAMLIFVELTIKLCAFKCYIDLY